MILIKKIGALQAKLALLRSSGKSIGFVPTMGALHRGHISLIEHARAENDVVVCSIFINPAQFNNKEDLKKYPVTIESDIDLLEAAGCSILFLPSVEEMYPANEEIKRYKLGILETILEGRFRPGHFQGVSIIVDKLLHAVQPHSLYLGRKDFQQCMVIAKMVETEKITVTIKIIDTMREPTGLAMSSRNKRLSVEQNETAVKIYEALRFIRDNDGKLDPPALAAEAAAFLAEQGFDTDYVEIADPQTLETIRTRESGKKVVALVAASIGDIRLIDNMLMELK